ncbi:MAG: VWA domain-containing protein, partial [Gammaproteobacteria bacterium]
GAVIDELNESYASKITARSVVVIMSDGWDTGDVEVLDHAMATLSNRAKSIVWINPLKGDANYEPLALGMATARPYCDEFIAGHSVDTLRAFARLLNA